MAPLVAVLPITALYLGLHTIVYALLSFKVAIGRGAAMSEKRKPENDPKWMRFNVAQNSFGQYFAPIFLVIAILEANSVLSPTYLYALGALITVARVSHVLQLSFPDQLPIQFRMFGFLTTALFFVVAGSLAFLVGLQETPYISSNLLGNHRSWLGYAHEKAGQATEAAQSGYQAAKDKAAEF